MGVPRNIEIKKTEMNVSASIAKTISEWTEQVRRVNKQPRRFTTRWKIFTSMGLK
jgi:hypothetical protein